MAAQSSIKQLEEDLWASADTLRASSKLNSNQYCMPVLGLIFLKYAYGRFKKVEAELLKDRPTRGGVPLPVTERDFQAKSALYLPREAQYDFLLNFPAYAIRPTQIKDNHFVLYLRGFCRDNYSETTEDLQKIDKSDSFSEGRFIHLLKQYLPVYAVGMTKELEAPHGANRVYLNDSEWEQEVEDLMSRATLIVILLNESNSCIWEIRHARKYKDKIVYICDNQDKLVNVRQKLNVLRESGIPIGVKVDTATFSDTKGLATTVQISHTDKGYSMFIHKLMKDKFGLNRHIFSNRGIKKIATVTGIILTPVLIGYFMLLDIHPFFKGIEHPYIWLSLALALFFIAPYIISELIYRQRRYKKMSGLLESTPSNALFN